MDSGLDQDSRAMALGLPGEIRARASFAAAQPAVQADALATGHLSLMSRLVLGKSAA